MIAIAIVWQLLRLDFVSLKNELWKPSRRECARYTSITRVSNQGTIVCEVRWARDRSDQHFSRGDTSSFRESARPVDPIHTATPSLPRCHECLQHHTRVPPWYLRPDFDNYTSRPYRNVFLRQDHLSKLRGLAHITISHLWTTTA
jgi:hypothetical protein